MHSPLAALSRSTSIISLRLGSSASLSSPFSSSCYVGFHCSAFLSCYSGVGTVAAVAALAATLFRPYINIHNLLSYLKLTSFSRSEAKVKQPPLLQSRMQLHALKYTVR